MRPGSWGSSVRDALLGLAPKDYDLTTSALPEETQRVFAAYPRIETGLRHGTVTVLLEGGTPGDHHLPGGRGLLRRPPPRWGDLHPQPAPGCRPAGLHHQRHGLRPRPGAAGLLRGAGGPGPGDHPRSGQGGDPLSRGRPAHPPGPAVCFRAGLHPGGGDPPGRPGLRPCRWRPSRRSGCSANWANSSAAKPPGGCFADLSPGAGGRWCRRSCPWWASTSEIPTTATMWDPHRRGGGPRAPGAPLRLAMLFHDIGKPDTFSLGGRMARGTSTATPGGAWSRRRPFSPGRGRPGRCGRPSCSWCATTTPSWRRAPSGSAAGSHKLGPDRFFDLLAIQRGMPPAWLRQIAQGWRGSSGWKSWPGRSFPRLPASPYGTWRWGRGPFGPGIPGPAIGRALRALLDQGLSETVSMKKCSLATVSANGCRKYRENGTLQQKERSMKNFENRPFPSFL